MLKAARSPCAVQLLGHASFLSLFLNNIFLHCGHRFMNLPYCHLFLLQVARSRPGSDRGIVANPLNPYSEFYFTNSAQQILYQPK